MGCCRSPPPARTMRLFRVFFQSAGRPNRPEAAAGSGLMRCAMNAGFGRPGRRVNDEQARANGMDHRPPPDADGDPRRRGGHARQQRRPEPRDHRVVGGTASRWSADRLLSCSTPRGSETDDSLHSGWQAQTRSRIPTGVDAVVLPTPSLISCAGYVVVELGQIVDHDLGDRARRNHRRPPGRVVAVERRQLRASTDEPPLHHSPSVLRDDLLSQRLVSLGTAALCSGPLVLALSGRRLRRPRRGGLTSR